jgi:hypothetical protein
MIMCKGNEAMLQLNRNYCNSVVPILTKTPTKVMSTMEMRLTVCEDFINLESILYSENLLLVYLSRFFVSHKINMIIRIQNGLKISGFKIRVNLTFCDHSSDFDSDTTTI